MKLSFRWFGTEDSVKLSYIRQIPYVSTVVAQVGADKLGGIIDKSTIIEYREQIRKSGLDFEVFESLPVHPDIKLGLFSRDFYIDMFKKNIQILSEAGIKVIVYNFRPIFRWARTEIYKSLEDGSTVSEFSNLDASKLDPFENKVTDSQWYRDNSRFIYERQLTTDLTLDGYYTEESTEILQDLRTQYQNLGKEGLWENLEYFLQEIIPVAERCGVKMAIHPDDPPWDIFGVPRLIVDEESLDRVIASYDSPSNGITFCSGTLGSHWKTDVVSMAKKYLKIDRIPFAHIRNVKASPGGARECAHYSDSGSIDMVSLLKAFYDNHFSGYIRSDHGRMIWGEEGKPGNGIYDRALGAQYILGIWECLGKLSSQFGNN